MPITIETHNLTRRFGGLVAVNQLNLSINSGGIFGLLGPNAAGKSTTTRLLAGILRPSSGNANILGLNLFTQTELIKQHIGYIAQQFALYPDLTVYENIPDLFSYGSLSNMPKMDVIDRDKEILVKVELPGIDKNDLDISITNNQLIIKAKTCHEEKEEKGNYLKQEISKNEIYRSVLLPADVDDDSKVKTSFKNGVLELTIPKQKKSHRRRIEVK